MCGVFSGQHSVESSGPGLCTKGGMCGVFSSQHSG